MPVGPSGGVNVVVVRDTVEFTNAEILAGPTTPLQLLEAQGAHQIIVPHLAVFRSRIVTPYGNIGPGAAGDPCVLNLAWGTSNMVASNLIPNDVPDGFASATDLLTNNGATALLGFVQSPNINQGANSFFTLIADPANQPLVLNIQNIIGGQSANFTGGHANNKLLVSFSYEIVDVTPS